jgi:hypothetical protein
VNVKDYIESGILETYVLGATTPDETRELMRMKALYPQVRTALTELEVDMERIAERMAIPPPPGTWDKIEDSINDLIVAPETLPRIREFKTDNRQHTNPQKERDHYIEVEGESSHMRIHKNWKWVFAAVFILGKIFLACAIYFYLENRQAQQQVQELKTELNHYRYTP